jgi:hypothetical protein
MPRVMTRVLMDVTNTPNPSGLPGGAALGQLVDGLSFWALMGCLAAVVVGGGTWFVSDRAGNFGAARWGRTSVFAGIAGSLVIGAASAIVNFFFHVGAGVH